MIRSFIATTLVFLAFALFETALLSNVVVLPATPDFLLIVLLYVSVQNGRLFGTTAGFVSGLFLDFFSGCPFGLNCMLRTVIGYLSGLFNKSLNMSGMLLPALQGLVASGVKILLLWLISLFFPTGVKGYMLFSFPRLFEIACNTFFTPLTFAFLAVFRRYLILDVETVS